MPKNRNNPVAVSGMYRSGTSIFWRILSADPMFQKRFYEPLHSLLIDRIVTNPAMDDFKSNPEIMKAWSPRFNFERIHLGKNESYPELYSYLQNILVHNSLTKFTRTTMRISWLAENFPNVFIINLIRDPRAVCLSYMRRGGIEFFLSGTRSLRERFNAIRYLTNYNSKFRLLRKLWQLSIDQMPIRKLHLVPPIKQKLQGVPCRSIYCHQQYLDSLTNDLVWGDVARFAKASSPQVAILSLWKINVLQSIRDVKTLGVERGISIKFEDFVESPEKTLNHIYQQMGVESVPREVLDEVHKRADSLQGIRGHEYDKKLSSSFTQKWKEIDDTVWRPLIEEARIDSLMTKLGYSF